MLKSDNSLAFVIKFSKRLVLVLSFLWGQDLLAQASLVFESGKEGHRSYRIPALLRMPNGELLAFAEGRVKNAGDFGDINLVLKRSQDDGKTWSPLELIVDYADLQAGNPAPVLDLLDPNYPKGVLYLFYNTGNNHENEVRKGFGLREVWFMRSFDAGRHWEPAVNITAQTHRPKHGPYQFKEDWRSYANTPGHAIQIKNGAYKGRLYVAGNHSQGPPQKDFSDYRAHAFYSDDHGQHFQLAESLQFPSSNESMAVELSNEALLMTVRNQSGNPKQRLMALSKDGGAHWEKEYLEPQLPDPTCQASILALGKGILAHCNPSDPKERNKLSLNISKDEGKTWKSTSFLISAPMGYQGDWTAYSDMAKINSSTIGILYEMEDYQKIVFQKVHWKKALKGK